jgi:hypothetical protein
MRRRALAGALSRTSQRSRPGRTHVPWSYRPHRCSIFLRDPSRRHDHEKSGWRAVPDQHRSRSQPGRCPGGMPPRSRRPRTCASGRVGITAVSRGWVGGRPRRGGTPVPDETVTAGCPRNYPVYRAAAASRPQAGCLPPHRDLLVRRPGRPDEQLATHPHHRQFPTGPPEQPQRVRPLAFPMVRHTRCRSDLTRPSPTDRRGGESKPRQPCQLGPRRCPRRSRTREVEVRASKPEPPGALVSRLVPRTSTGGGGAFTRR